MDMSLRCAVLYNLQLERKSMLIMCIYSSLLYYIIFGITYYEQCSDNIKHSLSIMPEDRVRLI